MHILDVVKWNATDNETVACKFIGSSHDDRFNTKSRLIVSTGQEAVVVINGKMTGPFKPCLEGYTMNTKNLPILTDIWSRLMYSGDTPYPAEVWFVQVSSAPDFGWGTNTPVTFGAEYKSPTRSVDITAGVRMFGKMGLAIVDTIKFMEKLVQTKPLYSRDDLRDTLNARLMQILKPALTRYVRKEGISVRDLTLAQDQIGKIVFDEFKKEISEYGLELLSFCVEDISLTSDTEARIRELDDNAIQVAKEDLERQTFGLSRKDEQQFEVARLAASNEGAGSMISPLVGASVGIGIAGGIAGNVMKAMPDMGSAMTPPPLPGATPPPLPSQPPAEYMIAVDGKQYGPYPVAMIVQWVREGRLAFRPDTLVWRSGWPAWVKYQDCAELSSVIGNAVHVMPPPLPNA